MPHKVAQMHCWSLHQLAAMVLRHKMTQGPDSTGRIEHCGPCTPGAVPGQQPGLEPHSASSSSERRVTRSRLMTCCHPARRTARPASAAALSGTTSACGRVRRGRQTSWARAGAGQPPGGCGHRSAASPSPRSCSARPRLQGEGVRVEKVRRTNQWRQRLGALWAGLLVGGG